MTLKEYCTKIGSQERAAQIIGITAGNLNRILNGHQKPHNLTIMRFKELGIDFAKEETTNG